MTWLITITISHLSEITTYQSKKELQSNKRVQKPAGLKT